MIRSIISETKATIDVEDDGTVVVGSSNEEAARKAISIIEGLTKEAEVGAVYTGKVTRLMNFGAFVEILPGKEGLVHISELDNHRVAKVEDVVKVGDEVTVKVIEIDHLGRINLSRKALLPGASDDEGGGGGIHTPAGRRFPNQQNQRFSHPNRGDRDSRRPYPAKK